MVASRSAIERVRRGDGNAALGLCGLVLLVRPENGADESARLRILRRGLGVSAAAVRQVQAAPAAEIGKPQTTLRLGGLLASSRPVIFGPEAPMPRQHA